MVAGSKTARVIVASINTAAAQPTPNLQQVKDRVMKDREGAALAAARELPHLSLSDALELTMLSARKDPNRHSRGRGLLRPQH